ncbi:MAG: N-carbamoylputrescine amidase [Termitinemataceae bacterium]
MRSVTVAACQFSCSWDRKENIQKADYFVRKAAEKGAQIVLLQELFETPYFCQKEKPEYFNLAFSAETNPAVLHFQKLAKELQVVIPVSFFEKANRAHYNSIAVIDADGSMLGIYRKSHIPDGPGYEEKYYFNPGDLGVKVWHTTYAPIGVGICWDQWYPELARAMVLQGAELLLYPTAIGSEPQDASIDSMEHWRIVQRGHAGANLVPVIVSNRVGTETIDDSRITFYGSSFIADEHGQLVESADRTGETVLVHTFDLDTIERTRASWGIFRDRRPDVYAALATYDGTTPHIGSKGSR